MREMNFTYFAYFYFFSICKTQKAQWFYLFYIILLFIPSPISFSSQVWFVYLLACNSLLIIPKILRFTMNGIVLHAMSSS